MPRYDYVCRACESTQEVRHAPGGDPGRCRECAGELRRVWSVPSIAFRGPGFYATDSRGGCAE